MPKKCILCCKTESVLIKDNNATNNCTNSNKLYVLCMYYVDDFGLILGTPKIKFISSTTVIHDHTLRYSTIVRKYSIYLLTFSAHVFVCLCNFQVYDEKMVPRRNISAWSGNYSMFY